jgi:hypothetical protein
MASPLLASTVGPGNWLLTRRHDLEIPSGAQVVLVKLNVYYGIYQQTLWGTVRELSRTSTVRPVVGHVFSESVSMLKFPQHPFGDPPQTPPLPLYGICNEFEPMGRGEEIVLVIRNEETEYKIDEFETETAVEERISDMRTVVMVRIVDKPIAEDTFSAEEVVRTVEKTPVEVALVA